MPGSPADRKPNFEVIGSAESLVGRVLVEQGLGKYCDPDFVRYTSREMQEALDMTREEMDRAAHQLLLQEQHGRPLSYQLQQNVTEQQPWSSSQQQEQQQPHQITGIGYQPLQEPPSQPVYHQLQPSNNRHRGSNRKQQQQQRQPPS
ncbi:hypothetical protein ACFW04_004358 [Cataglyphis niger]